MRADPSSPGVARMTYVLLAAGSGTRMGALTSDRAKVLVEVEGRSILAHNLDNIAATDPAADILVVAGYAADAVAAFVAARPDTRARVLVNRDFARAGPLLSIEVALAAMARTTDPITIGNGDTIFEPRALAALRDAETPVGLLASAAGAGDEDDVQIVVDDRTVTRAAKRIGAEGTLPVSAGLLRVSGEAALAALRGAVGEGLREEARIGRALTWHSVIERLASIGAGARARIVPRDWWWEFDSENCLERYRQSVASRTAG